MIDQVTKWYDGNFVFFINVIEDTAMYDTGCFHELMKSIDVFEIWHNIYEKVVL